MRKLLFSLLAAVSALCLTSCEDDEIARTLDGIWEGEVATSYFNYRWGRTTEYQYVDIEFNVDPYRYAKGTGVEYDYYDGSGRYYTRVYFDFEVRNGCIYLYYEDGADVYIASGYTLTDNRFSGVFCDCKTGNRLAAFDFYRQRNWRHDRYGDYYYRDDYYYDYYTGSPAAADSVKYEKNKTETITK